MSEARQRYALKLPDGWTVFDAPVPCEAGQGAVIARALSKEEAIKVLNSGGVTESEKLGARKELGGND